MEVKAILNRTRTAPQKARLVAKLIYGKNVNDAMNILQLTRKKAARIMQKILKSALANAEENHKVLDVDEMLTDTQDADRIERRKKAFFNSSFAYVSGTHTPVGLLV